MMYDLRERTREAHRRIRRICAEKEERGAIPPVMIVAAHPDDEVVGAGGLLRRIRESVYFIHITDGSPPDLGDAVAANCSSPEDYAALRRRELAFALAQAGIRVDRCHQLGIGDQKTAQNLESITRRLSGILARVQPEIVLTHAYEGGHPDHDSAAFAVQIACEILAESGRKAPARVEFTSYHAQAGGMRTGDFLPATSPVTEMRLTAYECDLKRRMFECFCSRRRVLAQFAIGVERFRPAPDYDFMRPPHAGSLCYDCGDFGISGAGWRSMARIATEALGVLV